MDGGLGGAGAQPAGARQAAGPRRPRPRAGARASRLGARPLLLPHLRRFRGVRHLPADPAARRLRPHPRRRRPARRRLRRPRHRRPPARRLACRPHRRRARARRSVPRRRPVRLAARLEVDDPLHGRRARLRGAARARQRRRLQAGGRALRGARRNCRRPGGRPRRPRRLLPAAAAGLLPRPHGGGLARLRAARRHLAGPLVARQPHLLTRRAGPRAHAAAAPRAYRGPRPRRRHRQLLDRGAGGRHRRRLAQPAALRRRARRLHLRRGLRHLGRRLPLRGVDPEAADADLLAARLAAGAQPRPVAQRRLPARHRLVAPHRADLHRPPLAAALVDAPAAVLGLPAGGGDHLPAGVRLDPFHDARPATR